MNKIFNTTFEVGLRVLILLHTVSPKGITIDRIAAYDFITVYGKLFGLSDSNLHGDNNYNFSEFSSRRLTCTTVLKELVLDGVITVTHSSSGYIYKLSPVGTEFVESLSTDYSKEYMHTAHIVHHHYSGKTDEKLIAEINKLAIKTLQRR